MLARSPARADGFDARPGIHRITNPGDRRIYFGTQVYAWSQDAAGQNVLVESDTTIASPPATWVAPHSTYNLRVKPPGGAPGQERAFRVMVKQLPDRSDIAAGRIVFALVQSLPAFVEPGGHAAAGLAGEFHGRPAHPDRQRRQTPRPHRQHPPRRPRRGAGPDRIRAPALGLAVLLSAPVHAGTIEIETDVGCRILEPSLMAATIAG